VKLIDRYTILSSIERVLHHRDAQLDAPCTLETMVLMVASELREASSRTYSYQGIIPAPAVAAFVDGTSTPAETQSICDAVMIDNSIIAELIAASDTHREVGLPPMPHELAERLFGMMPPAYEVRSVSRVKRKSRSAVLAVALTLAAMLAVALTVVFSRIHSVSVPDVAVDSNRNAVQLEAQGEQVDWIPSMVGAENTHQGEAPEVTTLIPVDGSTTPETEMASVDNAPTARERQHEKEVAVIPEKLPEPADVPLPIYHQLESLSWTVIQGMLAAQMDSVAPRNEGSQDYSARTPWKGIDVDTREHFLAPRNAMRWLTLPGCRAVAQFEGGGRLVLAPDTSVTIRTDRNLSALFRIQHGSLALLDMPASTAFQFESETLTTEEMVCEQESSLIVGFGPSGLQLHITSGAIASTGRRMGPGGFSVDAAGDIQIWEPPRKIPVWIGKDGPKLNLPKHVLGQITAAPNLLSAVDQQLKQILNDPNVSAADVQLAHLLANWEAALVDPHLFRLVGQPQPLLRQVAMVRLLQTPEWEPRYASIWNSVEHANPDMRQVELWKTLAGLTRRAGVPTAAQLDQLLQGLQASSMPVRAISDQLLRSFFVSGPAFDPTWNGQIQTRGAGVWRRYVVQATSMTRGGLK
jgi:hypothetical protein